MAAEYKIIGGDGREYGPASLEEIRQWCEDGRVAHGTPVWRSDQQRWQPAGGWDELKWDLPKFVPSPPPVAPGAPATVIVPVAAGFFVRLGAHLIDWFILTSLVTLITLPWAESLTALQKEALAEAQAVAPNYDILMKFLLLALAINLPIGCAYQTFFNGRFGATPGKQLLGLRIVREDGSRLGYGRAALRFAAELVTMMTFGAGYLLIAIHPEKRALHDLLAGTKVIRLR
ncbi:MAG TPA: RDD family protein [Verrucomicrobiota bacterium]|nr:hypothetical protein [Verrucomicrobiales bacterium]HRI16683.1 RDD family protein [Verrucomicrobiota bacterium]